MHFEMYLGRYFDISKSISRCISGDISRGISRCNSGGISGGILENWMAEKNTLAKVVDLASLGARFGPGAPDSDLGRFQIRVLHSGRRRGAENVNV